MKRSLLVALAVALLAAAGLWFALSRPDRRPGDSGQDSSHAGRNDRRERPERDPRPPRNPGTVPSGAGSDEVADLVGDPALTEDQLLGRLEKFVGDAGRPLPERLEALDHLINLSSDENPSALRNLASRRVLPPEIRRRLVSESLNYKAPLQGELLVLLMENAAGDERDEIRAELHALVRRDLGDDPAAWRRAIDELPDDPAAEDP